MSLVYKHLEIPLEKGDIIAVAYSNKFYLGIFKKYGDLGNVQYFPLTAIIHLLEERSDIVSELRKKLRNVPVSFINTRAPGRVIKMTKDNLSEQEYYEAARAIEFLKEIKHI